MSKANWPAFPAMHFDLKENEQGITIRDYFAAKAMQALIFRDEPCIPRDAYRLADAMLEEREQ